MHMGWGLGAARLIEPLGLVPSIETNKQKPKTICFICMKRGLQKERKGILSVLYFFLTKEDLKEL